MTHDSDGAAVAAAEEDNELDAQRVASYLRRHPDFLARNADLLKGMAAPDRWSGDEVVDIQRYMVESLRGELDGLRNCTQEVIEISRTNLASQSRTHAAVLALLAAADLDQLSRVVVDDLPLLLDIDIAVLGFEPSERGPLVAAEIRGLSAGVTDRLVGTGKDIALCKAMIDDEGLFGAALTLVRSGAIARLRPGADAPPGVLALGSRDEAAFHPGQGTKLITFLARVTERCVQRLLPTNGSAG